MKTFGLIMTTVLWFHLYRILCLRDAVEIVTRNTDQNHRNNLLIFSRNRANLREILRHTNATPIRSWNGIGYKCCLCSNIYPNTANLKEHFIKRHDMSKSTGPKDIKKICGREFRRLSVKLDITNLTCRVCQLEITDLKELLNHLKSTHTNMVTPDVQNHILPLKFYNDVIQCCGCTKEFNSFKTILEHMNEHTQNYICLYCSAGFINKSSLELHEGRHKKGEHRCKFCPKIFETASKKQNHERRSHLCVDRLSKCWHCGERFSGHRRKQLHMQDVHGIPMPVKEKVLCKICNKYYPDKNVYNKHMRRVHLVEKNHKCNFCDKEFFVVKELNQHLVTHTGEKNFQCYYCMKAFGRKSTLREHIRRHVNDKRFSCDDCGQRFTQKCSWRSHMLAKHGSKWDGKYTLKVTDQEKKYECNDCQRAFPKRPNFTQHYTHVHLKQGPKLRSCHLCDVFVTGSRRSRHMEEVHGLPRPTCAACGKKFCFPSKLIKHQKTVHMGEKNHPCTRCDKSFATRYAMLKHCETHSELRPYNCDVCGKKFKNKKGLSVHMDIHNNRRRYKCEACDRGFVQTSSLKYHITKHHPESV
ncbi:unnamed protein product [Leptidea sinapis]|uniref:C2H2-type domain-containing protein n=1 Tax=Leptidea sinapis TaxID=189913 RepID=A0A5E4QJ23_9NEOP|nr:unnamed protein product [Leptidea sinapis]